MGSVLVGFHFSSYFLNFSLNISLKLEGFITLWKYIFFFFLLFLQDSSENKSKQ